MLVRLAYTLELETITDRNKFLLLILSSDIISRLNTTFELRCYASTTSKTYPMPRRSVSRQSFCCSVELETTNERGLWRL
jgi:hypothetical protein